MIKTIDEIMNIVDNNNPFRFGLLYGNGGLGYKPTPYNISGNGINNIEYGKYHLIYKNKIIDDVSSPSPKIFDKNISDLISPNFKKEKVVYTIRLKKSNDKTMMSILEGSLINNNGNVKLVEKKNQYFTTIYFTDNNDVNEENIIKLVKKFKDKEIPILGMIDAKKFL